MMTSYEKELRDKWNRINYYHGGTLQLGVIHPLEWHVGYLSPETKALIAVIDEPVSNMESSKSVIASCKPRLDGQYALSLTLLLREQEDVFITMCGDIIEYSSDAGDRKTSLKKVLGRYGAWINLLRHRSSALLGINAQKGLVGELLYLKETIERGMEPWKAIAGWVGPDGADQDFSYENGWHEIKTVGASSSEITISSVEQLDSIIDGELIVTRVDKCAPEQAGAFTLYKLVHRIVSMINSDPAAVNDFFLKLGSAGYIDMQEYDKQSYVFSSKQAFKVDSTFPRFQRSQLKTEVVNIKYILSIPSLTQWMK